MFQIAFIVLAGLTFVYYAAFVSAFFIWNVQSLFLNLET